MEDLELSQNPMLFRRSILKNFLSEILLEIDPQISITRNTQDYFVQIFTKFILEKDCFEYWKVKNDR